MSPRRSLCLLVLCACPFAGVRGAAGQEPSRDRQTQPAVLPAAVVAGHAAYCGELYRDTAAAAKVLQQRIAELLAKPTPATLQAARAAWSSARRVYSLTEALRFYGGPVDDIEGYLNAWPVDESYIDSVVGRPEAGIINDAARWPNLTAAVLMPANERGGEANICVGWHAIEFLLWGQDLRADGPGDRPVGDFVDGVGRNAARRREYLQVITSLLVEQLGTLADAWAPDADNYRRAFERDPEAGLRKMLTGAAILTAFELGGERIAVAYETRDQEQEHCCFSDTSVADLVANQAGITAVFTGVRGDRRFGAGLLALVARRSAAAAADLDRKLAATAKALAAIPQPFDQAILGADDAPGRLAIRAALDALDEQTEAIVIAGRLLGFDLPLKPRG